MLHIIVRIHFSNDIILLIFIQSSIKAAPAQLIFSSISMGIINCLFRGKLGARNKVKTWDYLGLNEDIGFTGLENVGAGRKTGTKLG